MKTAIIGSRSLTVENLCEYIPCDTKEIVSGGARGIDECAEKYANEKGIKFTVFLPEYERFGKSAPLKRNRKIIDYSDLVIAFWDGKSKGTKHVIEECKKLNKKIKVYIIDKCAR